MPAEIPQILLPYLSPPSSSSIHLITSVLEAPANWLIVQSISAALRNDSHRKPLDRGEGVSQKSAGRSVVLCSLLRPLSLWVEIGKKAVRFIQGVDFLSLLSKQRILFIDGTDIYGRSPSLPTAHGTFTLRSHGIDELRTVIHNAIAKSQELSRERPSATGGAETVLIVDGLDFLIASQPEVSATGLCRIITNLSQLVYNTILTVSSDGPLLHGGQEPLTPFQTEHRALVTLFAHQSRLVFQLRGLDTGTAQDVTGVIRISHGGGYNDEVEEQILPDGEWLYKASGDGSVKIWSRGGSTA